MAVRRLAPKELQPASFAFSEENVAWARQTIAKYPEGRQASAVIPLLWRAQEQNGGWITEAIIRVVGEMLSMPYIRVLEVATFYTQFQLQPVGRKAHIQVCGTTPCQLRGAGDLISICKQRIHHDPFHLNESGDLSWEEVECLGACTNAPMLMVGKDVYEDLDKDSFNRLIDGFASGNPPKPGPQNGRQFSAPITGPTTLTSDMSQTRTAPATNGDGPALTDAEPKRPGEPANRRERPDPKPPAADATDKTP